MSLEPLTQKYGGNEEEAADPAVSECANEKGEDRPSDEAIEENREEAKLVAPVDDEAERGEVRRGETPADKEELLAEEPAAEEARIVAAVEEGGRRWSERTVAV